MPSVTVSQQEFFTYSQYLQELKTFQSCYKKNKLTFDSSSQTFVKFLPDSSLPLISQLSSAHIEALTNKISFINRMHIKLLSLDLTKREDCASLAAAFFKSYQKTISAWNATFLEANLRIQEPTISTPVLSTKTKEQENDEKALDRYFELLEKHPKLKRTDALNDHLQGTYEIIYDKEKIIEIRQEIYQNLFAKYKSLNLSEYEAHSHAIERSRIGVVHEDQFWTWIRDLVISPSGVKHTYNRMVWNCDMPRVGGAATLPVIIDNEGNKTFAVILAFRHATNSWEFEMPRGASKPNETSEETAKREAHEETGYVCENPKRLGEVTPDSGLTSQVLPIFSAEVKVEKETKHDKTEAIKGKYAFTFLELIEGFKKGFMEVEIDSKMTKVPLRDPFLAYALFMTQNESNQ